MKIIFHSLPPTQTTYPNLLQTCGTVKPDLKWAQSLFRPKDFSASCNKQVEAWSRARLEREDVGQYWPSLNVSSLPSPLQELGCSRGNGPGGWCAGVTSAWNMHGPVPPPGREAKRSKLSVAWVGAPRLSACLFQSNFGCDVLWLKQRGQARVSLFEGNL